MINQEYLQQWIEVREQIDTLQSLIKMGLDLYLRTQNVEHLITVKTDIDEVISKTSLEQELYQKVFSQI